jgi:LPS-assembly lipoprotein
LLFDKIYRSGRSAVLMLSLFVTASLSACTFQPLYAPSANLDGNISDDLSTKFAQINVGEVKTRVAQQVRNHLIFLLSNDSSSADPRYDVRLLVTSFERRLASNAVVSDTTAGSVTVTVSYALIDNELKQRIAGGNRSASAYFDRTSQNFSNQRAVRDAQNRAGKEVAETIRLALASDLRN